ERDHRVELSRAREAGGNGRELERTGNANERDRVLRDAVPLERVERPRNQVFHDGAVEARGNDGEARGAAQRVRASNHLDVRYTAPRISRAFYHTARSPALRLGFRGGVAPPREAVPPHGFRLDLGLTPERGSASISGRRRRLSQTGKPEIEAQRSEERRVGKECRTRWSRADYRNENNEARPG